MNRTEAVSAKSYRMRTAIIISSVFILLLMQACEEVHTLAWNKAETTIDGHQVIIKPCRMSYTRTMSDTPTDRHHIFACGDPDSPDKNKVRVVIKNEALSVNGKSYGTLNRGDSVEVKDGKVFINRQEAVEVAQR